MKKPLFTLRIDTAQPETREYFLLSMRNSDGRTFFPVAKHCHSGIADSTVLAAWVVLLSHMYRLHSVHANTVSMSPMAYLTVISAL